MPADGARPGSPAAGSRPSWAVVIPAYNEAERIGDALWSLRSQTEPADEIVVVDDGSTDDLEAAIAPYRDMVRMISQPNRGMAAARNTGTAQVQHSEWILFLDADDHLDERFLEALRDAVVADPDVDIVGTDALGFDDADGRTLYRHYERTSFAHDDQRSAIVERNFLLTGISVRRSRIEGIGGFDEGMRYCEDYECWMRLILTGSRVALARDTVLHRRHHGGNMSARRPEMIAWRMEVIRRALRDHELATNEVDHAMEALRRNARLLRMLLARRVIHGWADATDGRADHRGTRGEALRLLALDGPSARQRVLLATGVLAPTLTGRLAARLRDAG